MMHLWPSLFFEPVKAVPSAPDLSLADLAALLPLAVLCAASLLCTAIWLLAVSRHTCGHTHRCD